jgi:hypothetical protein
MEHNQLIFPSLPSAVKSTGSADESDIADSEPCPRFSSVTESSPSSGRFHWAVTPGETLTDLAISPLGETGSAVADEENLGSCRAGLRSLTAIVASSDTGIWSMILTYSIVVFFVLWIVIRRV